MNTSQDLKENVAATDWKLTEEIRSGVNQIFDDVGVPTYQNTPQIIHNPRVAAMRR